MLLIILYSIYTKVCMQNRKCRNKCLLNFGKEFICIYVSTRRVLLTCGTSTSSTLQHDAAVVRSTTPNEVNQVQRWSIPWCVRTVNAGFRRLPLRSASGLFVFNDSWCLILTHVQVRRHPTAPLTTARVDARHANRWSTRTRRNKAYTLDSVRSPLHMSAR